MSVTDADYCAEYAASCSKLLKLHDAKKRIAELEDEQANYWPVKRAVAPWIQKNAELLDRAEKVERERDELKAELIESNAACICGCDDHETDSDGESCGDPDHECLRASVAVRAAYLLQREKIAKLEEALNMLRDPLVLNSPHNILCVIDSALKGGA
jgi:hypothetical protein